MHESWERVTGRLMMQLPTCSSVVQPLRHALELSQEVQPGLSRNSHRPVHSRSRLLEHSPQTHPRPLHILRDSIRNSKGLLINIAISCTDVRKLACACMNAGAQRSGIRVRLQKLFNIVTELTAAEDVQVATRSRPRTANNIYM